MIERCHPVFVASKDHHKIISLSFHLLKQNFNCLCSVISFVAWCIQIVSLINEQNTTHSTLDDLFDFWSGMAHLLTNQIISRDGDDMAFAQITKPMKDL